MSMGNKDRSVFEERSLESKVQCLDKLFYQMPKRRRRKSITVAKYMQILAENVLEDGCYWKDPELCQEFIEKIPVSARWFDIGYTMEGDWKKHMVTGMDLISNVSGDEPKSRYEDILWCVAMDCALEHHENWDGSGDPYHLQGEEIHIMARVCAICHDFYDYQMKFMEEWNASQKAAQVVMEGGGSRYDPALIRIFKNSVDQLIAAGKQMEKLSV